MPIRPLAAVFLFAAIAIPAAAQPSAILDEPFDDNARGWPVDPGDNGPSVIRDGVYRIAFDMPGRDYFIDYPTPIDPQKDYTVETSVRLVTGVTDQGYGIAWGKSGVSMNLFLVTGDGHVKVTTHHNGWTDHVPFTRSTALLPVGMMNTLRVERRGSRIRYLVNDVEVASTGALTLYGLGVGPYLQQTMTLEYDRIVVRQERGPIRVAPGVPDRVERVNLGPSVNSRWVEYTPLISPDGRTLYFSSRNHPENTGGVDDADEIWYSTATSDSTWGHRARMGAPLNNAANNWVISVTPDNNTLLLANTYNADGSARGSGFSLSRRTASGWELPREVVVHGFVNRSHVNTFSLAPSRRSLVMSVVGDGTFGGHDLYVSHENADGTWSTPVNLGPAVNTFGDEYTPFVAADGATLYFTSNAHPGYGRGDVFVTRRLDDSWTRWSEPLNLGPGINTPAEEGGFTVAASGRWAYLVSDRNTLGESDIFRLRLPATVAPGASVLVGGRVLDASTNEPLAAEIVYRELATDREVGRASARPSDGAYQIVLPAGAVYSFLAERAGYYATSDNLAVDTAGGYREIRRDLLLTPVEVGATIRLNNVFFDSGKWELRAESHPELERVARLLEANPTIAIEIAGHTDDIGADADNLTLSTNRARAVETWLAGRGIAGSRMSSAGYGETKPVATNGSDEGRQMNRRVEFTIRGR